MKLQHRYLFILVEDESLEVQLTEEKAGHV